MEINQENLWESPNSEASSFSIVSASETAGIDALTSKPLVTDGNLKTISELRRWLQPTDYLSPGNEYMKHVAAYVPGTGAWLRETQAFRHWIKGDETTEPETRNLEFPSTIDQAKNCLWIKGVPGTGKSVVAASTAQSLLASEPTRAAVLFFFFRQIVATNHSPIYLVRDWCAQLLPHNAAFHRELSALSQRQTAAGNEMTVLWGVLSTALKGMKRVYCIADALDEMDESHWDTFLPFLKALPQCSTGIRLLLTSRPIPRLEMALKDPAIDSIKLEPALIYPDITTYTNVRLLSLPPKAKLSTTKEGEVQKMICERANGLFIHARLMIDNLTATLIEGTVTEETLPNSLERLPKNLRELYTGMLNEHSRRSGITKEQQFKILTCVISSSRPLRLIELASMICWMRGDNPESLNSYKRLVQKSCGRLLEILEDETVSVIHHSFTEFLCDETRTLDDIDAFPVLRSAEAQKNLALMSLEYLAACSLPPNAKALFERSAISVDQSADTDEEGQGEIESNLDEEDDGGRNQSKEQVRDGAVTQLRLDYPLVEYASSNLAHHIRGCSPDPKSDLDVDIVASLERNFTPTATAFRTVLLHRWKSTALAFVTPLHIAADMQMEKYVEYLLATGYVEVDAQDGEGRTSLAHTCVGASLQSSEAESTNVTIAKILLKFGADPDMPNHVGLKPLHLAVTANNADIVELLLDAGVSPLTPRTEDDAYMMNEFYISTKGNTPLMDACLRKEHREILKMFLARIPKEKDILYKILAWVNDAEIVQEVLDMADGKLNFNVLLEGKTPLYEAVRDQNTQLIEIFLRAGADPNIRSNDGWYIDSRSSTDSIRVEIPMGNETGPTPLHSWARPKYGVDNATAQENLRLLLRAGAEINAETLKDKETVLHEAVKEKCSDWCFSGCEEQREQRVSLALDAGVDPDARNQYGETALHTLGHKMSALVGILVSGGADVNAKDARGHTPLSKALKIRSWSGGDRNLGVLIQLCREFLKHGADIATRDNFGNTLAHGLISMLEEKSYSHPDVRKLWDLFIKAGLDLNTKNDKGQTPISIYRQGNFAHTDEDEDLIKYLGGAGMILKTTDEDAAKAMFTIVDNYDPKLEALKRLVGEGFPVNIHGNKGKYLLHSAVRGDACFSRGIVQYLFQQGACPTAADSNGNTIMHAFALGSHQLLKAERYLKLLLQNGVPFTKKNLAGQLPLHLAAGTSHSEIMHRDQSALNNFLDIYKTAAYDINAADADGATPVHYAASVSEWQLARLLAAGADAKVVTREGVSPLYVSCRARESNAVGLLLSEYEKQGVLSDWINRKDTGSFQRSPLHIAARSGQAESVWYLLRNGADVNAVDIEGRTALHVVAEVDEEASFWVDSGGGRVDTDAAGIRLDEIHRPQNQYSVSFRVRERSGSCREIIDMLISAGVKLDAKAVHPSSGNEYTALEYAVEKKNEEMIRILQAKLDLDPSFALRKDPTTHLLDETQDSTTSFDALLRLRNDDHILQLIESKKMDLTIQDDGYLKPIALHKLIDQGKTGLLELFSSDVRRMHDLESMLEEDYPGILLMHTCRRDLPSIHILQVLIDKIGLDVGAKSDRQSGTYALAKDTPLHQLAFGSYFWNIEGVKYLLEKGADIEAKNEQGKTPLAGLASSGWPSAHWMVETGRVLLQAGANPNAVDKYGRSPLNNTRSPEMIRLLIEFGADVSTNFSPLRDAVDDRNVESVEIILGMGVDTNIFIRDKYLLHEISQCSEAFAEYGESDQDIEEETAKRVEISKLLLEHGADPHLECGSTTLLHLIIEDHGVLDPFWKLKDLDIEKRGEGGRSLLISACVPTTPSYPVGYGQSRPKTCGFPDAALKLIEMGAKVEIMDNKGRTALHWLCTQPDDLDENHQAVFTAIIQKSTSLINKPDIQGYTPLHLANSHLHAWTANELLSLGVDPTIPDPNGNTPLHALAPALFGAKATATKAAAQFQHFLTLGLDINAKNNLGETPLFRFIATRLSDLPTYIATAQNEAIKDPYSDEDASMSYPLYNPDEGDISHCSALHIFVDAGADLHTTNDAGETLLHVTSKRSTNGVGWESRQSEQQRDIVATFKRLVELGVDPKAEDSKCRTSVDIAVACGYTEIVGLFAPKQS